MYSEGPTYLRGHLVSSLRPKWRRHLSSCHKNYDIGYAFANRKKN